VGLPGQLAKKPLSVWVVQGLLALGAAFMVLVLIVGQEKFASADRSGVGLAANLMVFFTISVQVGLLVGIQLRQQWARWITAGLFVLSLLANVVALSGNTGSRFAGNVVGALLAMAIVARFAFGAPARRYFAREIVLY
jgi:hypothetical protein